MRTYKTPSERRASSPTERGLLLSARRLVRKAGASRRAVVPGDTATRVATGNDAVKSAPQARREAASDCLVASLAGCAKEDAPVKAGGPRGRLFGRRLFWRPAPRGARACFTLSLSPSGRAVLLVKGRRLLGGIIRAGLPIGRSCGGVGICGACRVWVLEGEVSPALPKEEATLRRVSADAKERLACQARVRSDAVIACAAWGPLPR